jgi:hypothetical protein
MRGNTKTFINKYNSHQFKLVDGQYSSINGSTKIPGDIAKELLDNKKLVEVNTKSFDLAGIYKIIK